jgi:ABC-type transporter Mla subunit MlaD
MQRPRWHDLVLVLGVIALLGVGVWALWGQDIRAWFSPEKPVPAATPPSGGMT